MHKRFACLILAILCGGAFFYVRWDSQPAPDAAAESTGITTAAERVKTLQARAKQNSNRLAEAKAVSESLR